MIKFFSNDFVLAVLQGNKEEVRRLAALREIPQERVRVCDATRRRAEELRNVDEHKWM